MQHHIGALFIPATELRGMEAGCLLLRGSTKLWHFEPFSDRQRSAQSETISANCLLCSAFPNPERIVSELLVTLGGCRE